MLPRLAAPSTLTTPPGVTRMGTIGDALPAAAAMRSYSRTTSYAGGGGSETGGAAARRTGDSVPAALWFCTPGTRTDGGVRAGCRGVPASRGDGAAVVCMPHGLTGEAWGVGATTGARGSGDLSYSLE